MLSKLINEISSIYIIEFQEREVELPKSPFKIQLNRMIISVINSTW